jgi:ADP-heptose:LPS heptosyltransferase
VRICPVILPRRVPVLMVAGMRILVLQLKRIGDTILTAPALEMTRALWPEATIEAVLHGPSLGLAPMLPGLDRVHHWRDGALNLETIAEVARGDWDLAMDFTGTDRSFFLLALSRARARFAWEKQASTGRFRRWATTHPVAASVRDLCTVDYHLAMVRAAARDLAGREAPPMPPPPHLLVPPPAGATLVLPEKYVVIHPGTARDEKYWPAESWITVARHLAKERGFPVVMTGAGDQREAAHLESLRAACLPGLIDLAGKLGLTESAAIISRASLVITVDSAAMHLAGQFARPQIALFGPTNPYHWAPRHPRAIVLASPGGRVDPAGIDPKSYLGGSMREIAPEAVLQAIDELS